MRVRLRLAFARWGRPARLRTDNGAPWGSTGGLPTELELWLAGLGVRLLRNGPRRPWDNGVVERSQGTGKRWADPRACTSPEGLQVRLDEEDRLQREEYPSVAGQSRRQAYPGLLHSGRGYAEGWEAFGWDWEAALDCLGGYEVSRKVSRDGKVSLYDRGHYLGRPYAGQRVGARLDAHSREWVLRGADGTELGRRPAAELSRDAIVGLRVARPRAAVSAG